jgi:hypothetical protein
VAALVAREVKAATPMDSGGSGASSSLTGSPAWTAGINPPGSGSGNPPGTGDTLADATLADAAGAACAAAAPASWPGALGPGRSRAETVESKRKAIAPADTTMSGTVLPAGWERKTAPAWPRPVLIRSLNRASTSCGAGSAGQ